MRNFVSRVEFANDYSANDHDMGPVKTGSIFFALLQPYVRVPLYRSEIMNKDTLTALLRRSIPDAEVVDFVDLTGGGDHLSVHIRSSAFRGRTLLDQHRLVYAAVQDARDDGRIHALQMKTIATENQA
jgi:stress-induced morphogen